MKKTILRLKTLIIVLLVTALSGCNSKNTFKPDESVFYTNFFHYQDATISKDLYGVTASKVINCCMPIKSKQLFDEYLRSKIDIARTLKQEPNLVAFSEDNQHLLIPHSDAPTGVIDGGTFIANDSLVCTSFIRSKLKDGFVQSQTDEGCDSLSSVK